jgi:hypothetical protein
LISASKFAVRKTATASAVAVLFVEMRTRTSNDKGKAGQIPRENDKKKSKGKSIVPFLIRARCASNGVG